MMSRGRLYAPVTTFPVTRVLVMRVAGVVVLTHRWKGVKHGSTRSELEFGFRIRFSERPEGITSIKN